MTVPNDFNTKTYELNGSATEFDTEFQFFEDSQLQVFLVVDEVETELTLNTDYSVSGATEPSGGTVTYPISGDPGDDGELVIKRVLPVVQETSFRNQGAYYPETVERAIDESRMIDQQQQEAIDRSMKTPDGVQTYFDAQDQQIRNLGYRDPLQPGDAVPYDAMLAYFQSLESGELGDTSLVTADGTTDERNLAVWMAVVLANLSKIESLFTQNRGATEPDPTYPDMIWVDTANGLIKQRTGADDAWLTRAELVSGQWVPYSAGESVETRFVRLAQNNTFTGANEFEQAPTIDGDAAITRVQNMGTTRQTTERGPIDANGLPDLLEDAGGLQVQTKGISASTPLVVVLTLSDDEDYRVRLTSNLAAVTISDDTDDQQIVLDVTPEETPELVVTPVWTFAEVAPGSPSTGDVWYNTPHWGLPQEWDGSAWVDKYYSFPLGQASAASGAVTEVVTYAYQGQAIIRPASTTLAAGPNNFNHNIGTSEARLDAFSVRHLTATGGWAIGDTFDFISFVPFGVSSGVSRSLNVEITGKNVNLVRGSNADISATNKATGANLTVSWSDVEIYRIAVKRTF